MNMDLHVAPEQCVVCECVKYVGIHVRENFICLECESEIVQTDTDSPRYLFFVKQLKQIDMSLQE